ncbi:MAG: hypothetical protein NZM08_06265 [Chitinophagales bacterium]|nr:hypothetical protein [Chitinophagales bacterium]
MVGQQHIKSMLRSGIKAHRAAHAYLFLGEEGYGPLPLAWAFARYANCTETSETDACGHCASCRKMDKLIHPDLHLAFPAYKQKSDEEAPTRNKQFLQQFRSALTANPYLDYEDWLACLAPEGKQLNLTAEDCRSLLQRLMLRHFEGTYKIALIWQAGLLGKEGNILLKMLEEPPPNTLWMLIARNSDELLPTIVSRCQLITVGPIAEEDLVQVLRARHTLSEDQARHLARACEGNWNDAQRLLQQQISDMAPVFVEWLNVLAANDLLAAWKWTEHIGSLSREEQKAFFRYALAFLRQWLYARFAANGQYRISDEELQLTRRTLARLNPPQLQQLACWLERCRYFIERNAHARLVFLNLTLRTRSLIAA